MNIIPSMTTDEKRDYPVPQHLYLKEHRIERGWKQQQLADLMGTR